MAIHQPPIDYIEKSCGDGSRDSSRNALWKKSSAVLFFSVIVYLGMMIAA